MDWSFRASRPYDDIICVAHFLHFMTSSVLRIFLHFKAHCVKSVSTSIKNIIINVLKNREARNDQLNRHNAFVENLFCIEGIPKIKPYFR